jgi:hypothetical protein
LAPKQLEEIKAMGLFVLAACATPTPEFIVGRFLLAFGPDESIRQRF